MEEMPRDRWATRALSRNPEINFDGWISRAKRRQGRPRTRWVDSFIDFSEKIYGEKLEWMELKTNSDFWQNFENDYANNHETSNCRIL